MKTSKIVLVFASLLVAGLLSGAAHAACPCATEACVAESQGTERGPNFCSDTPDDLLFTDGQGCVEVTPPGEEDCTACVGGAVRSLNDETPPELVLAKGCACTINEGSNPTSWTCISTRGVNVNDPEANVPGTIPDDLIEVEEEVVVGSDPPSWCEMKAEMACSADVPMM